MVEIGLRFGSGRRGKGEGMGKGRRVEEGFRKGEGGD